MKTISEILSLGLTEEDIRRHLPPTILNIARATSLKTAFRFAEEFSSQQFYLPSTAKSWKFSKVIGLEDAERIIEALGGNRYVDVPPAFGNRILTRLEGIALLKGGASLNEVSGKLGVSRSAVKVWRRDFIESVK